MPLDALRFKAKYVYGTQLPGPLVRKPKLVAYGYVPVMPSIKFPDTVSTTEDPTPIEDMEMFQSYISGFAPLIMGGTTVGVVDAPLY